MVPARTHNILVASPPHPRPAPALESPILESPVTATEKTARYYRPELDILRGLAFLSVFTHHLLSADVEPNQLRFTDVVAEAGASGVCLFFMLSAFLITELLLREKEATGTIHMRAFYVRRVLRIWPLYLLLLTLSLVLPRVVPMLHHPGLGVAALFLFFSGNWSCIASGWPHSALLGPLWSVSVEEQFYLLWPALVLLSGARGIRVAAVALLPLAWAFDFALPALHFPKEPALWCNSLNQFQFFALGGALALYTHGRKNRAGNTSSLIRGWRRRTTALAAGVALLLLAAWPFHFLAQLPSSFPGQTLVGYLCLDAATLLIFTAFLGARIPRFSRPLLYLGKISYGMYVFHLAAFFFVERLVFRKLHLHTAALKPEVYAVTLLLTLATAATSYHFYEKPFLRFKDRFTFVPSRRA